VQVAISFTNVPVSVFNSTSGRSNIAAAIAKAAGVDSSKVKIIRLTNKATGSIIYSSTNSRLLQVASVEVTSLIQADSASKASEIGNSIKTSASAFSATILSSLKASDSVSFSSASAEVDVTSIISPPVVPTTDNKSSLTDGAIAGIVIAALLIVGAGLVYYACFCRPIKDDVTNTETVSSTSTSTSSSSGKDMVSENSNDVEVSHKFATANPMQVRISSKAKKADFDPTMSADSDV
jgi:hypothetical protein